LDTAADDRRGGVTAGAALGALRAAICAALPAAALFPGQVQAAAVQGAELPTTTLPTTSLQSAAVENATLQSVFGAPEIIQIAMFSGAMGAALLAAGWMIRARATLARDNSLLAGRVAEQSAALERYAVLGEMVGQMAMIWVGSDPKPDIVGQLPPAAGVPESRAAVAGFARWLPADVTLALQAALEALRRDGRPFSTVVRTITGLALEVDGRTSGNRVVLRFVALSAAQLESAASENAASAMRVERDALRDLAETSSSPHWRRDADGRLVWVNAAYAAAVGRPDAGTVIEEQAEFLSTATRRQIAEAHAQGRPFSETVSTVVDRDRRRFAIIDIPRETGSLGHAIDVSEAERLRGELDRQTKNHAETLDQLSTAVAIFDAGQRLVFHNQAFQALWKLDDAFLAGKPSHAILIDRWRRDGLLEEKPDWKAFKASLLERYRAVETEPETWHLPDGRVLRVISNPNPHGGLTQVFENLTEQITLETENKTLMQVRRETLDHLVEGVAVFASDGTLRLANPAFSDLWGLSLLPMKEGVHIRSVAAAARPAKGEQPWPGFIAEVTGAEGTRSRKTGRVEFNDGTVVAHSVIHLPNGQTMLTAVDVTDGVNAERNLKARNKALQDSALVKNRFVHHMSYELRSPLTSIKGFAEILQLGARGVLNADQKGYVGHILDAAGRLEMLVNDVLDLATIDAELMQLVHGPVDVRATIEAAAGLLAARLEEHRIGVAIEVSPEAAHFEGDAMRVRQVLFNLIDNASNYAPEGSVITVTAGGKGDKVAISVADKGPGIPFEDLETILARFEHRFNGGRRRGAGIGLSIVSSFVKLHGGTVTIDSAPDRGTLVTCVFPRHAAGSTAVAPMDAQVDAQVDAPMDAPADPMVPPPARAATG
jgi:signal transduction histidine kinase